VRNPPVNSVQVQAGRLVARSFRVPLQSQGESSPGYTCPRVWVLVLCAVLERVRDLGLWADLPSSPSGIVRNGSPIIPLAGCSTRTVGWGLGLEPGMIWSRVDTTHLGRSSHIVGFPQWGRIERPPVSAVQYPGQVGLSFFGSPPVTERKFPGVYVPSCLGPSSLCSSGACSGLGLRADLAQSSCDESGSFR